MTLSDLERQDAIFQADFLNNAGSPILRVLLYLYLHPLTQNDQIRHREGHVSRSVTQFFRFRQFCDVTENLFHNYCAV